MKIQELGTPSVFEAARALLSAGTALYLTWKGKAQWEPKIDVPQLPQRIVGLLSAVLLAWISLDPGWTRDVDLFHKSLTVLCSLCLVAALLYLFVWVINVYHTKAGNPTRTRIIGGFRLIPSARTELKRRKTKLTVQNYLLRRAGGDPDKVWTRPSRAAMQVLFVVCYITFSVAGTGVLSFAAQAYVNRHVAPKPPPPKKWPSQKTPAKPAESSPSQEKDSTPVPSAPSLPSGPSGAMPPESSPWGDEGISNSSARTG